MRGPSASISSVPSAAFDGGEVRVELSPDSPPSSVGRFRCVPDGEPESAAFAALTGVFGEDNVKASMPLLNMDTSLLEGPASAFAAVLLILEVERGRFEVVLGD